MDAYPGYLIIRDRINDWFLYHTIDTRFTRRTTSQRKKRKNYRNNKK